MSVDALEHIRGEHFVKNVPNWENDILEQILEDIAEENRSKTERKTPEVKAAPKTVETQGSGARSQHGIPTYTTSQEDPVRTRTLSTADRSSDEIGPGNDAHGQEALHNPFVEHKNRRPSQTVTKQQTKDIHNTNAATVTQPKEKVQVQVPASLGGAFQEQGRSTPNHLGKRQRDLTPGVDDILEVAPPPKKHLQVRKFWGSPANSGGYPARPNLQPANGVHREHYNHASVGPQKRTNPLPPNQIPLQHLALDPQPGSTASHLDQIPHQQPVAGYQNGGCLIPPGQVLVQHTGVGPQTKRPSVIPNQNPSQRPVARPQAGRSPIPPHQMATQHPETEPLNGNASILPSQVALQRPVLGPQNGRPQMPPTHMPSQHLEVGNRRMTPRQQPRPNGQPPANTPFDYQRTAPPPHQEVSIMSAPGGQRMIPGQQSRPTGQPTANAPIGHQQAFIPPYQLRSVMSDRRGQPRVPTQQPRSDSQPVSNLRSAPGVMSYEPGTKRQFPAPSLPQQDFYPFPRATNHVPSQSQTGISGPQYGQLPQPQTHAGHPALPTHTTGQPQHHHNGWLAQLQRTAPQSRIPSQAGAPVQVREPKAHSLYTPQQVQGMSGTPNHTNGSFAQGSKQKRGWASTVEGAAGENMIPGSKRPRVSNAPLTATPPKPPKPPKPTLNSSKGPRPPSGFRRTPSGWHQPRQRLSARAPTGYPSPSDASRQMLQAQTDRSSTGTKAFSHSVQLGQSTTEAPIKIDDLVPPQLHTAPDAPVAAARSVLKPDSSGSSHQESAGAVVDDRNKDKPWENENDMDTWMAKELEGFDEETTEPAATTPAISNPAPAPIFISFRDRRPVTKADVENVHAAMIHTMTDYYNRYPNSDFSRFDEGKDSSYESFGHQYNRIQLRFASDCQTIETTLSSGKSKRKSKKQKQAERAQEFLYEVEGPWLTGFDDWKPTNAPEDLTGWRGPLQKKTKN